jgi:hypothetical protein
MFACGYHWHTLTFRPGGTISGPALMAIADGAAWAAVLSYRGPDISPVSTSLHIDFVRRPDPDGLVADGVVLTLGRTLAAVEVSIRSARTETLVAKAQVTPAFHAIGKCSTERLQSERAVSGAGSVPVTWERLGPSYSSVDNERPNASASS